MNTTRTIRAGLTGVAILAGALAGPAAGAAAPEPVQLATTANASCARMTDGTVRCWGTLVGDGTNAARHTPVTVANLTGVVDITGGTNHFCVATTAGRVRCWGENNEGQIGDGTISTRLSPADVTPPGAGVIDVEAGGTTSCARTASLDLWCWGRHTKYVAPGQPVQAGSQLQPLLLGADVARMTVGSKGVMCGQTPPRPAPDQRMVSGCLAHWYSYGKVARWEPTDLTSFTVVKHLGFASGCSLYGTGTISCTGWDGAGGYGELGNGSFTPVPAGQMSISNVPGAPWSAYDLGYLHSCGFQTQVGEYRCWGANWYGQLGDGTKTHRSIPVPVGGFTAPAASQSSISAGFYHSCAIGTSAGRRAVYCWGTDLAGQLGNGAGGSSTKPVKAVGI